MGTQFGISTVFDRQWLPARNVGGSTIPAFGAVVVTSRISSGMETVLTVRQTTLGDFLRYPIVLNGPAQIAAGAVGNVTSADKPAQGLTDSVSATTYGTLPGSYYLFPGLPGLQGCGEGYFTRGQCQSQFWAVATGNWVDRSGNDSYCMASVLSGQFGSAYPIAITLYLPRNGLAKAPNVKTGNVVPWSLGVVGGAPAAVASGNYLDDPIGAYRILSGGSTPPQGWRLYNFGARLLRGGSSGTGGTTTHDHGTVTMHRWFEENPEGVATADTRTAYNVPEHHVATFMERFE